MSLRSPSNSAHLSILILVPHPCRWPERSWTLPHATQWWKPWLLPSSPVLLIAHRTTLFPMRRGALATSHSTPVLTKMGK